MNQIFDNLKNEGFDNAEILNALKELYHPNFTLNDTNTGVIIPPGIPPSIIGPLIGRLSNAQGQVDKIIAYITQPTRAGRALAPEGATVSLLFTAAEDATRLTAYQEALAKVKLRFPGVVIPDWAKNMLLNDTKAPTSIFESKIESFYKANAPPTPSTPQVVINKDPVAGSGGDIPKILTPAEQAAADQLAAERAAAAEKAAADQLAAEKAAADQLAAERAAAKVAADKVAAQALADKLKADKAAADKLVADRLAAKAASDLVKSTRLTGYQTAIDKLNLKLGAKINIPNNLKQLLLNDMDAPVSSFEGKIEQTFNYLTAQESQKYTFFTSAVNSAKTEVDLAVIDVHTKFQVVKDTQAELSALVKSNPYSVRITELLQTLKDKKAILNTSQLNLGSKLNQLGIKDGELSVAQKAFNKNSSALNGNFKKLVFIPENVTEAEFTNVTSKGIVDDANKALQDFPAVRQAEEASFISRVEAKLKLTNAKIVSAETAIAEETRILNTKKLALADAKTMTESTTAEIQAKRLKILSAKTEYEVALGKVNGSITARNALINTRLGNVNIGILEQHAPTSTALKTFTTGTKIVSSEVAGADVVISELNTVLQTMGETDTRSLIQAFNATEPELTAARTEVSSLQSTLEIQQRPLPDYMVSKKAQMKLRIRNTLAKLERAADRLETALTASNTAYSKATTRLATFKNMLKTTLGKTTTEVRHYKGQSESYNK